MSFQRLSIITAPVDPVWRDLPAQGLQVLIALPEGHDVFSLSILLDLLAAANLISGRAHFTCDVVAETQVAQALDRLGGVEPDRCLLLVADAEERAAFPPALLRSLIGVWRKGGRVGAWGSGCLALAQAGLLTSRRFVLPAEYRARLSARWPRLCPVNQSFCDDHRVLTSVGKSIISDIALHLVQQHCGRRVMVEAMDQCLIRRAPDDGLPARDLRATGIANTEPRIVVVDDWIDRNIVRRVRTRDIAVAAGLSIRQLERLFLRQTGRTPGDHLDHKRMSLALKLMRETDLGVEEIARSTGHHNPTTFRRKFKRKFGISPRRF